MATKYYNYDPVWAQAEVKKTPPKVEPIVFLNSIRDQYELAVHLQKHGYYITAVKNKRQQRLNNGHIFNDQAYATRREKMPDELLRYCFLEKQYDVAICTGPDSGLMVVDCDCAAAKILASCLTPTPMMVKTKHDGLHLYYAHPHADYVGTNLVQVKGILKNGAMPSKIRVLGSNLKVDILSAHKYVVGWLADGYKLAGEADILTVANLKHLPVFDPSWFGYASAEALPVTIEYGVEFLNMNSYPRERHDVEPGMQALTDIKATFQEKRNMMDVKVSTGRRKRRKTT